MSAILNATEIKDRVSKIKLFLMWIMISGEGDMIKYVTGLLH